MPYPIILENPAVYTFQPWPQIKQNTRVLLPRRKCGNLFRRCTMARSKSYSYMVSIRSLGCQPRLNLAVRANMCPRSYRSQPSRMKPHDKQIIYSLTITDLNPGDI